MAKNDYTAEQIQVLEGLEPVRKRPGMYIGSTDTRGLHECLREIVDNSVDESFAGVAKNIWVLFTTMAQLRSVTTVEVSLLINTKVVFRPWKSP